MSPFERYGAELAGKVWDRLRRMKEGDGLREAHPEYCGHGLLRRGKGVALETIEDGAGSRTLKAWTEKADFVGYFALLTDFICGGHDPTHPHFYSEVEWELDNQRIRKDRLEEFTA